MKSRSLLSICFASVACLLFALPSVTSVPLKTYTFISSGYIPVYNATHGPSTPHGAYTPQHYCSVTSVAIGNLEDSCLWVTPVSCTTLQSSSQASSQESGSVTDLWTFTTQSKWLKDKEQVSVTLNGSFEGSVTGDSIFYIDPSEWNIYSTFQNNLGAAISHAISHSSIRDEYVFAVVLPESQPTLNFSVTDDPNIIVGTFLQQYYSTFDPTLRSGLLLQLVTWAGVNQLFSVRSSTVSSLWVRHWLSMSANRLLLVWLPSTTNYHRVRLTLPTLLQNDSVR